MSTIREQILTAIVTALTGTTNVGTRIYRSRPEAFTRAETPALLVLWVQDPSVQDVIGYLQQSLLVRVIVMTRGAVPDQLADPIVDSVHAKIMADQTLGGLCQDIQPQGFNNQVEEGDKPGCFIACDYNVIYRTKLTNLSAGV